MAVGFSPSLSEWYVDAPAVRQCDVSTSLVDDDCERIHCSACWNTQGHVTCFPLTEGPFSGWFILTCENSGSSVDP